jgi:hypothetical protein
MIWQCRWFWLVDIRIQDIKMLTGILKVSPPMLLLPQFFYFFKMSFSKFSSIPLLACYLLLPYTTVVFGIYFLSYTIYPFILFPSYLYTHILLTLLIESLMPKEYTLQYTGSIYINIICTALFIYIFPIWLYKYPTWLYFSNTPLWIPHLPGWRHCEAT